MPPEMKTVPVNGIDSYVSEYASRDLKLSFDFGAYGSLGIDSCRGKSACSIAAVNLDGVRAHRAQYTSEEPRTGAPYKLGYYIPFETHPSDPHWKISLTIWAECATIAACALADRIVKTIDIYPAH